jgi:hypothetical protein
LSEKSETLESLHYSTVFATFEYLALLQDAVRTEKISKRIQQLDTINNNVKLLNDMLHNHQPGSATQSDKEIMKVR